MKKLNNSTKAALAAIFVMLGSIFGRIGGKGGFKNAKLFRRIGSTVCCFLICYMYSTVSFWLTLVVAYGLIMYGACSYFGIINNLNKGDCTKCAIYPQSKCFYYGGLDAKKKAICNIESEYFHNFLVEGVVMMLGAMILGGNILVSLLGAVVASGGKVLIDKSDIKHQDVYSELWFWGVIPLFMWISFIV